MVSTRKNRAAAQGKFSYGVERPPFHGSGLIVDRVDDFDGFCFWNWLQMDHQDERAILELASDSDERGRRRFQAITSESELGNFEPRLSQQI